MHRTVVQFVISGQAMNLIRASDLYRNPERYDPGNADAREASEALRYPDTIRRFQRGRLSHTVMMPPASARLVWEYCETIGRALKLQSDLPARKDGDALLIVADKIKEKLKESGQ